VLDQVKGKAGARLFETAGRYKKFGASPEAIARLGDLHQQVSSLPRTKAPGEPRGPARVDPVELRRRILESYAGRPYGFWEMISPPHLMRRLLYHSPRFREWLATQARQGE
jgi:hypothetical protein